MINTILRIKTNLIDYAAKMFDQLIFGLDHMLNKSYKINYSDQKDKSIYSEPKFSKIETWL